MLHGLSEQIVHCHFRAAECRVSAKHCVSVSDRELCVEREQAWLALARSYKLAERLGHMIKELQRQAWGWPPGGVIWVPNCPTGDVEMGLLAEKPTLVQPTAIFERAFFQCPNCGAVSAHMAALPRE